MEKGKKKSLVRYVTFSLIVLFILYILSVVNFHLFVDSHEKQQIKEEQFNNIELLLNELNMVVNEMDRLSSLYVLTQEKEILDDYNNMIGVYNGDSTRNDEIYSIYHNEKKTYKELIRKEVKQYNQAFINDLNLLLVNFDLIMEKQQEQMENQNDNFRLKASNYFEEEESLNYNDMLDLNEEIETLKNSISNYHTNLVEELNYKSYIWKISWNIINTLILFYAFYLLIKMYILLIKPIKKAHALVEEINKGNDQIRLSYPYHNELSDVVNSFNRYIDISQSSLKLIIEQYNKLKLYSDTGEINYFEYNFISREIKINYSKNFVEKYYLGRSDITYTYKEYLSLIHKDDVKPLMRYVRDIYQNRNKNYKIEFRIKLRSTDYCYISTVGQRNGDLFIGVQVDITDLKITQKLLQDREEKYRLIVENTTDLIAKIKPDGEIMYASKSYREAFENNFNSSLKLAVLRWLENVKSPPYSIQEKLLLNTSHGEKWISWNNVAILNENNEIEYIISVGHDITAIQHANERLQYDSEHDMLTNLLNRRGLFNKINNYKDLKNLAVFFIDINNFKNINDLYGHEIGDMIIVKIAEDLVKFENIGCVIGRLSGDEFIILLPNFTSLNFIKNRIRRITAKNYKVLNNDIFISSSIGYAIYPDDTDDLSKIISFADIAMYEAKMTQNKKSLRFMHEMYDVVNKKVEMSNALKRALDLDEFEIYFQPIVNMEFSEIEYLEALVRWKSPNGWVFPDEFLPIAEESGFMQALDLLIIKKALNSFYKYKHITQKQILKLSVNVSPIMLLQEDFPLRISDLVRKHRLKNEEICIEISENTFVNNIEQSGIQINKLRKLGFIVALDDFGREYSSLSILEHVEFDLIKIDRLFINNLCYETNVEIINMIIKIAHLKNKEVIAEGVETDDQKDKLNILGCYLMQGYLFAKPQPMIDGVLLVEKEMNK